MSLRTNIATILFSADHALFEQHHAVVGAKHGLHGRSVYVIAAYLARSEIVIGDAVQRLGRKADDACAFALRTPYESGEPLGANHGRPALELAGAAGGAAPGAEAKKDDGDVVDAEYTEVKDKK